MTPSQELAIRRINRFYTENVSHSPDKYSITHDTPQDYGSFVTVVFTVTRTDCEPHSPRAVICGDGGHFMIGKRGGIKIGSTHKVIGDRQRRDEYLKHMAYMLQAKIA